MYLNYFKKTLTSLLLASLIATGLLLANKSFEKISLASETSSINPDKNAVSINTPFDPNFQVNLPIFPEKTCFLTDYGAIGDGQTKNTAAFEKAIAACAASGGGKVNVPPGTWLTGPIELKSNIDLDLAEGAKIVFTTDFEDYLPPVFSRFEGIEDYTFSPLIRADHAQNVAITGRGTIDGQGQTWWNFNSGSSINKLYSMGENGTPAAKRIFATAPNGLRPSFIEFTDCSRILISGVSILRGPMWTIHPVYSQDITIQNTDINTAPGPSTDGIVIDSSKNVLVENTTLATGDDAITIKSGRDNDGRNINISSENIVLRDININDAHGAVAIGSEISGNVYNVLAQNFNVASAQYGFRVKSNQQRGGEAKNIWIENFNINKLQDAIAQFNAYYERRGTIYTDYPPAFQNIHLENITSRNSTDSINIFGLEDNLDSISDLSFKNINIQKARSGMKISGAKNLSFDNVSVSSKYGPVFGLRDTQDITITNSRCKNTAVTCLSLGGDNLKNIRLDKESFSSRPNYLFFEQGADKKQFKVQ